MPKTEKIPNDGRTKNESQKLSRSASYWMDKTEFRAERAGALISGLKGLEETDQAVEVARAVARRLNSVEPNEVVIQPYNRTRDLTVSALKSPGGPRDRLYRGSVGLQPIKPGSTSEAGMAIDQAVHMPNESDCISEPEELTIEIKMLGVTVLGHTDGSAFEKPVEIKSVSTMIPQIGFDDFNRYNRSPFWQLKGYMMQISMYQLATESNGFLVLVARDTGTVVCFEVDYRHAMRTLVYEFKSWLEENTGDFRTAIEAYKRGADYRENWSGERDGVLG